MTIYEPAPAMRIEAIRTKAGYPRWLALNVPAVERIFADNGWRYDSANKVWWTEQAALYRAVVEVHTHVMTPSADRAWMFVWRVSAGASATTPETEHSVHRQASVPADLGAFTLRQYQLAGAEWLITHKRTILGDEMGIGKTFQAIAAAVALDKPVYVFCPSALALQWAHVIDEVTGKSVRIITTGSSRAWAETADWIIVPYGALSAGLTPGVQKELRDYAESHIAIIDEAHMLGGSGESKRTAEALGPDGIATRCEYLWALTGTPITASALNLLPLIQAMRPTLIGKDEFLKKFCTLKSTDFGDKWGGLRNESELYDLLRLSGLLMRRLKSDVLTELPPKTRAVVRLASENGWGAAERHFAAERHLTVDQLVAAMGEMGDHRGWGTELSQLRMQSTKARAPRIVEYVRALHAAGAARIVIWCQFQESVDAIVDGINEALTGPDAWGFHGGLTRLDRDLALQQIASRDDSVFVATMAGAGTGVDGLQGVCSTACIVEYPWNPGTMWQAEDRLHRDGQRDAVQIHCLVEDGSIESSILKLALRKSESIDVAVDDAVDVENAVDGNTWWP